MALKILPFKDEYAKAFYELNIEWLETYFYVEDFDKEVLSNPKKYIINPGGYLFLVAENDTIIGTVALMPYSERVFELTKMAVAPRHQRK